MPKMKKKYHFSHQILTLQKRMKKILFLGAIVLLGSVLMWPTLKRWQAYYSDFSSNQLYQLTEREVLSYTNKMYQPVYDTYDSYGRPSQVKGELVKQKNANEVMFSNPSGHFHMASGTPASYKARKGLYNKTTQTIHLYESVHLTSENGYELFTDGAYYSPKKAVAWGDQPVYGTGPLGEKIHAKGFRFLVDEDRIVLMGQSEMTFHTNK